MPLQNNNEQIHIPTHENPMAKLLTVSVSSMGKIQNGVDTQTRVPLTPLTKEMLAIFCGLEIFPLSGQWHPPKFIFLQTQLKPPWESHDPRCGFDFRLKLCILGRVVLSIERLFLVNLAISDLQGDDLLYYDAEIELMNMILLAIPNEIYNSMDSCKTTKEMWNRVERLMRGTIQNQVDRETRFTNEFDQFVAELGESLVSVYNRFA
ncbi:hypothetical protein Tco_1027697 [Tanacetum coccineum]